MKEQVVIEFDTDLFQHKQCIIKEWTYYIQLWIGIQIQVYLQHWTNFSVSNTSSYNLMDGTFLTNYDVTNRKLKDDLTYTIVQKWTIWEQNNLLETYSSHTSFAHKWDWLIFNPNQNWEMCTFAKWVNFYYKYNHCRI